MADETQDLENQLKLNQELNRLVVERQSTLAAQNQAMSAQANLANALNGILSQMAGNTEDSSTNSSNLADALQRAQEAAADGGAAGVNLASALGNATAQAGKLRQTQKGFWDEFAEGIENADSFSDIMDEVSNVSLADMAKQLGIAADEAGLLGAAIAGISLGDLSAGFTSTFKQIGSVITGAFSAVQNIGTGIFGALSGAMGLLAEAGHQAGGGGMEVANAWESVKKTISTVGPGFEAVQGAVDNLGMAGASVGAMFGSGPGGMAAAIQYAGEVAGELGATLGKVTDDFAKNIDSYVIANKALGLSGTAMTNMQLMAAHSGQELSDMLDTTARATVHLSQQFGVDAKLIGKNLDEMTSDYATFGGMSVESMTATAAYAGKLGIAMKDLQGITAKTDDFEGAADAASGLAATFGMTIDTMDLMNADPAEKAEMIRQSFLETGQSFDDMSRQEKARMAELSGMSVEGLAGAFDPENAELGMDDFESAADAAAAGAISQEEANLVLAKSIDKVHEALGGGSEQLGGPFSAFFDGVTKGIVNSEEFIALAQNFYGVMEQMHAAGEKIGAAFVKAFPGVQDLLTGLTDLFDPAKWEVMMKKVMAVFDTFFADLATDPEAAVQNLLDNLLGIFDNFMDGNKGAVDTMKAGAVKMITAIGGIISGMIPWLTEKLVEAIRGMASALSGEGASSKPSSIGGALMKAFGDAFRALMKALPTIVWELLKGLGKVMINNKAIVAGAIGVIGLYIGAQLMMAAAKAALLEWAKQKMLIWAGVQQDSPEIEEQTPGAGRSAVESMGEIISAIKEIDEGDVWKAVKIGLALVVFAGTTIVLMAGALALAALALSGTSWEDLAKALVAVGVAVLAVWGLSKISKQLKVSDMTKGGLGLIAGAAFLGIAGGLFAVALMVVAKILSGITLGRTVEMLLMIGVAALTVWGAALSAFTLVADGGLILLAGGLGLLAGAAFLFIVGGAFALALMAVHKIFEGVDLVRVIAILGTMGLTMIAIAGLAVGGAILLAATPILIAAVPGLKAGAKLLVQASGVFAVALTDMVNIFSKIPGGLDAVEKAIDIVGNSLKAVAGLAFLGVAFKIFMPVVRFISSGVTAAADFAATAFKDVGRVLDAITAIKIVDPDKVQKIVNIVGAVIDAVASVGGLGIDMAKIGIAGEMFGDTSMDDMITMVVRFIDAVGDTISGLIIMLVDLAGGMDENALKGAASIAAMIGAVADLASAMSGPITAVVENEGAIDGIIGALGGTTMDDKIKSVVEGMTDLLNAIGPAIPGLVKSMVRGLKHMPEGMGEKAKAFGDMLKGISSVLKMWEEYQDNMPEGEAATEFDSAGMASSMNALTSIIGWSGWKRTADAMIEASQLVIDVSGAEAWMAGTAALADISENITTQMHRIYESGIMDLEYHILTGAVERVAQVVAAYNQQAESLSSITPFNIDAVLEQVNESLAVRRDKLTIEDGNVTINMSLNVTMKAEDVAIPMIESDLVVKGSSLKVASL